MWTSTIFDYLDEALGERPSTGRLLAGYSGGLDSSVLLHSLVAWLDRKRPSWDLVAVHVNHGISSHAQRWQEHCASFADALGVPMQIERVRVTSGKGGLEATAREARYAVFKRLLRRDDILLLAHHREDQAETFLLRALRGAGTRGLSGMPAQRSLGEGFLLRPFLEAAPELLREYARTRGISWIEDDSNMDMSFDRNYLRLRIMPQLEARWPRSRERLARAAHHLREAHELQKEIGMSEVHGVSSGERQMRLSELQRMTARRRRNILMTWVEMAGLAPLSERLLREIERQVMTGRNLAIRLPGARLASHDRRLFLLVGRPPVLEECTWDLRKGALDLGYGRLLAVPGIGGGLRMDCHPVRIVARAGGERIRWRAHHRKVKKLLQELRVPPWTRACLPLLVVNDELVAIADLAIADRWRVRHGEPGWRLVWQPSSDYAHHGSGR